MRNDVELKSGERKLWVAPQLLVIKAGSAESGNGTIPDGGPPNSARS